MMQGSSKSLALKASSVARYCLPVTVTEHNSTRTFSAVTGSDSTASSTNKMNNNSVIPTLPELHYKPEIITIDAATQALYAQLQRGEFWDRQPEELRLLSGTDKESIVRYSPCALFACFFFIYVRYPHQVNFLLQYKLGKHRSNALELVHRVPVVEVAGDMAICDGGGGGLGHPLEYISLVVPDSINYCKYCSLRYTKKKGSKSSAH